MRRSDTQWQCVCCMVVFLQNAQDPRWLDMSRFPLTLSLQWRQEDRTTALVSMRLAWRLRLVREEQGHIVLFAIAMVRVIKACVHDLIVLGDVPSFICGTAAMTREPLGIPDDMRPNLSMLCRNVLRNVCLLASYRCCSPLESQRPGRSWMYVVGTVFLCLIDNHVTGDEHYFCIYCVLRGGDEC